MFCPECGKELTNDSVFCEYCGARVDDDGETAGNVPVNAANSAPAPAAPTNQKTGSNNKNTLIIIIALILVVAVGAVILFRLQENDDPEIEETSAVEEEHFEEEDYEDEPYEEVTYEEDTSEEEPIEEEPVEEETSEEEKTVSLEPVTPVEPEDFDWVNNGLSGAEEFSDIEKASGKWKCLIHAGNTGTAPERFMYSEVDIQYHGNTVTIYMDVISRYELEGDDFYKLETDSGVVVTYDGKWDEAAGSIEAKSRSSELRFVIDRFGDSGDAQYAIGDAINGEKPLGEIYFVRP